MGSSESQFSFDQKERFSSHMNIQTNEIVTHRIQTKGICLYFQPYNPKHTFGYLAKQYQLYSKKKMILQNTKICFLADMPVGQIGINYQLEKLVQSILNKLQDKEEVESIQLQKIQKQLVQVGQKGSFLASINKKEQIKNNKMLSQQIQLKLNYFGQIKIMSHRLPLNISYRQLEKDLLSKFEELKWYKINIKAKQLQKSKEHNLERKYLQIYDHQYNLIASNNFKQSIYKANSRITVLIHGAECQFSQNSKILLSNNEGFNEVSLSVIKQPQGFVIGALNIKNKQIVKTAKFSTNQKISNSNNFFNIQLQSEQHRIKREAYFYKNQLVLNEHFDWIRVQLLKAGMNIYGIDNQKDGKLILLTISLIHKSDISSSINTFTISSPDYLNLIIDGIIVHNQNPINIFFSQMNQIYMKKCQISALRNDTFDKYLKADQQCFYGDFKVQRSQSFGDYHLQDNDTLYISKNRQVLFQQIAISIKKTHFTQNISCCFEYLQEIFHQLRYDYLGIWKKQLIQFSQEQCQWFKNNHCSIVHIIGQKNGYLNKINFQQNILKKKYKNKKGLFEQYIRQYGHLHSSIPINFYRHYDKYQQKASYNVPKIDIQNYFAIYLYTTNLMYHLLNEFLLQQYNKVFKVSKQNYDISYDKWVPVADWISKSLQLLPNYEGICFRGMKDVKLQYIFALNEKNQTVSFPSFNSASIYKNVAAQTFSNQQGIIMTIYSRKGKEITDYSQFAIQGQILFSPFTNFLILDFNQKAAPQTITLQEIPVPATNLINLTYWVDDNPHFNQNQIYQLREREIEVVQVTSTKLMQIIIKRFFRSYKLLGKKINIISDMVRKQNEHQNLEAGLDLLNIIYNEYSLTIHSFIYTSENYVENAKLQIRKRKFPIDKISVLGRKSELIDAVAQSFEKK